MPTYQKPTQENLRPSLTYSLTAGAGELTKTFTAGTNQLMLCAVDQPVKYHLLGAAGDALLPTGVVEVVEISPGDVLYYTRFGGTDASFNVTEMG